MSLALEPSRPLAAWMSPGAVLYSGTAGVRIRAEKKRMIA